ncbi:MAG TPA: peptide ABC transporter substrate-binding protein [Pyrinomonadaceae bacterium]|nr:peptide ABC transporter substrate-binding protein [Pyrinomonadaceae bacterium]
MYNSGRSSRLRLFLVLMLTGVLLASSSCARVEQGNAEFFGKIDPPEGQVLRYISGSEPESLDPQIGTGQPEARIYMALFEGLAEYDPKTQRPIPAIAERWVIDEDNSEFVFQLRHDARWSNGEPITAHDFVYTLRRGLAPALAARSAYLAYEIKYAQGYNEGGAFVRDPRTGRFVTALEAAPDDETKGAAAATAGTNVPADPDALHEAELSKGGEDTAPDTPFHRFIHEPTRLIVPADGAAREKAAKANPKLAALIAGKEFVPVRAEDIGVEAVDDHTLRLTLAQPAPYFIGLIPHSFFRVVPRKAIEQHGALWTRPQNIVTSGPFKLQAHKPYNEVVVVRDPMYWDTARVKLEKISFYPFEEATTMLNLYKAGEVDAIYNHTVPASWIEKMRPMKDYMDAPENAIEYYMINVTKPPMNDRRVRRAFNMAIDKQAVSDYRKVTKPLTAFTPEGIFHGYPRPKGDDFNPEAAKKLLAEAGYKDAFGNYDPKKFPVKDVEINYNTTETNRQIAEFVQAQWKQNLGITVPLKNSEWKTFLNMRSKLEYKGFARAGWVGDYLDPFTFLALFSTISGDNGTGWFEPKYAAMLKEANSEPDAAKRYAMLGQAEAYLIDVQPLIPLVTNATNWMKKPYVKGLYPNPGTLHAWKYVYIEHDPAKWDRGVPDMTPNADE